MSLFDERVNAFHAAMAEAHDHPGWAAVDAHEAREAARKAAEQADRDLAESIEAEEAHWAGVFAADPHPNAYWSGESGPDRRLHNVSGLNHP